MSRRQPLNSADISKAVKLRLRILEILGHPSSSHIIESVENCTNSSIRKGNVQLMIFVKFKAYHTPHADVLSLNI